MEYFFDEVIRAINGEELREKTYLLNVRIKENGINILYREDDILKTKRFDEIEDFEEWFCEQKEWSYY